MAKRGRKPGTVVGFFGEAVITLPVPNPGGSSSIGVCNTTPSVPCYVFINRRHVVAIAYYGDGGETRELLEDFCFSLGELARMSGNGEPAPELEEALAEAHFLLQRLMGRPEIGADKSPELSAAVPGIKSRADQLCEIFKGVRLTSRQLSRMAELQKKVMLPEKEEEIRYGVGMCISAIDDMRKKVLKAQFDY